MPRKSSLKVDFHVHSDVSKDSDMTPRTIISSARKNGLDAIAVTDHDTIKGALEVQKISDGLVVFVGAEIKTKSGEVIGLNLKKDIEAGLSLEATCKRIKEQGGFLIIPHPFDRFRNGIGKAIEKIVNYIDAVEVFNARILVNRFNEEAMEFAKKHSLPVVAGSDSHFVNEIGSAFTLVKADKSRDGILRAIKNGYAEIGGKKTGVLPHWKTFVTKMGKKL